MKSQLIEIDKTEIKSLPNTDTQSNTDYPFIWELTYPLLPAFSVEYFTAQDGAVSAIFTNDDIDGHVITMLSEYDLIPEIKSMSIILHYHGIREYALLFPWVSNIDLQTRLGNFYEETEKCFEQGAWLSFSLMCGAIFEGMLYAKLSYPNSDNFSVMINDAFSRNLITAVQRRIMDFVRAKRNLVHGGRFNENYITRKDAMDIRVTLDKLIKDFC